MTIEQIHEFLKGYETRRSPEQCSPVFQILEGLKREAVASGNQMKAKYIWCLEQVLGIQNRFWAMFDGLKDEKFYDSWCELERLENSLRALRHHFHDPQNAYGMIFIQSHIQRFQKLFPYAVFISPEFRIGKRICSICGTQITPRSDCGHQRGEVYDGRICRHRLEDIELLATAIVTDPVQKYSVMFLVDDATKERIDQHDYSLIHYLSRVLESPFHAWDFELTKMKHPRHVFTEVDASDPCPCESGEKFEICCFNADEILIQHCQFHLSAQPPPELATLQLPNYRNRELRKSSDALFTVPLLSAETEA